MIPFPTVEGGYRTILADPAWRYGDALPGPGRGAEKHYSTMTVQEICDLPVSAVAAERAHLYLCVTNSFMRYGYDVVEAWGFEPKTILTWVKTSAAGTVRIGMGRYLRNATEHVIFAARGKSPILEPLRRDVPNVIFAPRDVHSAKPEALYELIRSVSPGPRIEMFSRQIREGFDGWGLGFPGGVEADPEMGEIL